MFSKSCEYAIRAVLFIAQETMEERRTNLSAIAGAIDSPEAFTAKILQELVHKGIIKSLKGPNGGFEIEAAILRKLKLADIVEAVDGQYFIYQMWAGLERLRFRASVPIASKLCGGAQCLTADDGTNGSSHVGRRCRMRSGLSQIRVMKKDIETLEDIQLMVNRFYEVVRKDELIGPHL
jgi:Rrf2 family iron-sulfur cluster assembly transcriptional regulator